MKNFESQSSDIEKYLKSGPQTQITPEILEFTSKLQGTTLEKIEQIFNVVSSFNVVKHDKDIFRKRTGSEIIDDCYITGCTDEGLAFITLARACGIPAKYIEAIDNKWLKNGGGSISGHIYSQIYNKEDGQWHWVDPDARKIDVPPVTRTIFKEGLDSWDIGIKDFESMKLLFNKFREDYIKKPKKSKN